MADLERSLERNGALSIISLLNRILCRIDTILFPAHCLACGEFGAWICHDCEYAIRWIHKPHKAPSLPSAKKSEVTRYWSLALYADRSVQEVIRALKYRGATCIAPVLERWFSLFVQRHGRVLPWLRGEAWVLVPVPTVPSHVRERGLDHALVLAEAAHRVMPSLILTTNLVTRAEETGFANAELDDDRLREANVMNQWVIKNAVPKRILLIDDVYTTGSTVQSLASVLLECGAEQVEIMTLATGK